MARLKKAAAKKTTTKPKKAAKAVKTTKAIAKNTKAAKPNKKTTSKTVKVTKTAKTTKATKTAKVAKITKANKTTKAAKTNKASFEQQFLNTLAPLTKAMTKECLKLEKELASINSQIAKTTKNTAAAQAKLAAIADKGQKKGLTPALKKQTKQIEKSLAGTEKQVQDFHKAFATTQDALVAATLNLTKASSLSETILDFNTAWEKHEAKMIKFIIADMPQLATAESTDKKRSPKAKLANTENNNEEAEEPSKRRGRPKKSATPVQEPTEDAYGLEDTMEEADIEEEDIEIDFEQDYPEEISAESEAESELLD